MPGWRYRETFGRKKQAWDQIFANDKLPNASFFIVGKDPMVQAMDRTIPGTLSGIREPVLTPAVQDRFAQFCRLHNHCT
jgi:hypothetical protein